MASIIQSSRNGRVVREQRIDSYDEIAGVLKIILEEMKLGDEVHVVVISTRKEVFKG